MELSTRSRRALSTVLALFLAVESVSAVAAAAATRPVTYALPAENPAGRLLAAEAPAAPRAAAVLAGTPATAPAGAPHIVEPVDAPAAKAVPAKAPVAARVPVARVRDPLAKAAAAAKVHKSAAPARTTSASKAKPSATRFTGTNRVWVPELGINRSLAYFPCSRTRAPDNYMYRWGCAGSNNVYILGHAYGVMHPLYNAYVSGRLHKGMKAYYADSKGRVHVYTVRWWKKTRPTTDAAWAWASQSVPSMTLQTCVGANSAYRLMVRLVEVRG